MGHPRRASWLLTCASATASIFAMACGPSSTVGNEDRSIEPTTVDLPGGHPVGEPNPVDEGDAGPVEAGSGDDGADGSDYIPRDPVIPTDG